MKFIALRIHDSPGLPRCGITMYGYQYGDDPRPYWSMKFYEQTWRFPMSPDLIDVQSLKNCNTCKWNVSDQCENSNWKDGKLIVDAFNPQCGYLTKESVTPTGFSAVNKKI